MNEFSDTPPAAISPAIAVVIAAATALALACLALSAWLATRPAPGIDVPRTPEIIIDTVRPATPPAFTGCPTLILPFDPTDTMVVSR